MICRDRLVKINGTFQMEISVIKEHIEFMEMSVILTGLKNRKYSLTEDNVDHLFIANISNIQNKIETLSLKNQSDISDIKNKITGSQFHEIPKWFSIIDSRSNEGELINFIYELIDCGVTDKEEIMSELMNQLEYLCIKEGENIEGDFYLNLYGSKEETYKYIDFTLKIYHNNLIYKNQERLQELNNIEKLLRLIDTKNNINIYRQAFIQLMALFDAFVFDIIRIRFKDNFFEWLKLFENDTIKSHDMARYDNFDQFENTIIDQKLKGMYLKELMHILKSHNHELLIIDGATKYANFIEMINRRNCHIHNNGVIDNSYLGINRNSDKPEFNIYKLDIGSYAEIDQEYLNGALYYCSEFISNITQI